VLARLDVRLPVRAAPTVMASLADRERLARTVLDFADGLADEDAVARKVRQ
jgi:hypothetical protein